MGHYQFKSTQRLPISVQQAWDFFSTPENLAKITPASMNFKTLYDSGNNKMFAGQIINYRVTPLLGIPMFWMTEITHVKELGYFIDEQRFGPWAFWHHTHIFKEIPGGVEMTDLLSYKPPFSFIGDITHAIFLKRQIRDIFDYRTRVLEETFGKL